VELKFAAASAKRKVVLDARILFRRE